jgi:hypothetical protein
MFEISGVFAEKFHPQGQVIRMKGAFKMGLNTEIGVVRFLEEQKPFAELKIMNRVENKDVTKYFLEKVDALKKS